MRALVDRYCKVGQLARNASAAAIWNGVRVLALASTVVVLARLLGPSNYGRFVGVAAMATVAGGLSGLGLGLVMYQRTAIEASVFSRYWTVSARTTWFSGLTLSAILVLGAPLLMGDAGSGIVVLLCLSDTVLAPLVTNAAFAFSAHERISWAAGLPATLALFRLAGALSFSVLAPEPTVATYAGFHLAATALASGFAMLMVRRCLRPSKDSARWTLGDFRTGLEFSAGWATNAALSGLDKTLALKLAGAEVAGIYGASYRVATLFAMPVEALTQAALPRLFRNSATPSEYPRLLGALVRAVAAYSLLCVALLYAISYLLPWLLGDEFQPAVLAAQSLCLLPALYAMRNLGSNVLVARGLRRARAAIEAAGVVVMFLCALALLPAGGLTGMAIVISLTEGAVALGLWVTIWLRGSHVPQNAGSSTR